MSSFNTGNENCIVMSVSSVVGNCVELNLPLPRETKRLGTLKMFAQKFSSAVTFKHPTNIFLLHRVGLTAARGGMVEAMVAA